jgi:arylsulfatase A-like enzyme
MDSDNPSTAAYGRQCLLARRLVERGVRFVELTMIGAKGMGSMSNPWDQHTNLEQGHAANAKTVDQPVAGLLADLKSRGLSEETLVIFSGEFGRTPFVQGTNGRDHNPYGFSLWMAGGGLKRGTIYGQTDEYGYRVVEGQRTIHDLHATILHLLGLDHEKLTFRFGGRDFRLTDVHGHLIEEILA